MKSILCTVFYAVPGMRNLDFLFTHGGFYGSLLAFDPEGRITISANIGQANPPYDTGKLVKQLLDIILGE